jgi:hypothetical protein
MNMAVLVEAISVVTRVDFIKERFLGGEDAFEAVIPNATACSDGELVRIGFMTPSDVEAFIRVLEANGFRYLVDGVAQDLVVVDQQRGPMAACEWIEVGRVSLDAAGCEKVTIARLVGSEVASLSLPNQWDYRSSLSYSFGFSANSSGESPGLRFLRHENGMDVYWDKLSGKEVFVGRAGGQGA